MSKIKPTLNMESATKRYNRMQTITASMDGEPIRCYVQGNGNEVIVMDEENNPVVGDDGQPLRKVIYNTNLKSDVAARNPINTQILKDAIALERAGKHEEASEKYWEFLNAVGVSFNIWANRETRFTHDQMIQATVELVTSKKEHKGQLITLVKPAAVVAKTVKSTAIDSLDELLAGITTGEQPVEPNGTADDVSKALGIQ